MTTENTGKLSYEELMKQLNDPALLQAAAAKLGLKISAPENKKVEKRELPSFEIPEDADMPTLIKSLNKGFAQVFSHIDGRLEEGVGAVKNEVVKSKEEETRAKVQKFAKEHKDFEELIPMIEPFFATGKYSIEEAYELGRKASGKAPEGKETKKDTETPPRLSKTSDNADIELEKAKKPLSARDAAKINLDKLLKERADNSDDILGENDEVK